MQPELRGKVTLEAAVAPSEDPKKVLEVMRNLIGGFECEIDEGRLMIRLVSKEIGSLDTLRNQFRDRHVRGAARKLLLWERKGNSTTLMFNRQAATVGVAAICSSADQSALGPIYLTIASRELGAVIDWLTAYESG